MERESAIFWHIKYLEKYNSEGINPMGLQIQIFPSFNDIAEDFKTWWELTLKQCSKLILQTLMEEFRKRFDTMNNEIRLLLTQGEKCASHELYKTKDIQLKQHLELFNNNLIRNKDGKFQCDQSAFEDKWAYRWPVPKSKRFFKI